MSKTKIILAQYDVQGVVVPAGKLKYEVVSLVNRTRPMVGEILTENDVKQLKTNAENLEDLTIEIKASKRRQI